MGLDHRPAPDGIVLVVLHQVGLGVGLFVGSHHLIRGHLNRREATGVGALGSETGSPYPSDLPHRGPLGQEGRNLPGGPLPHAVGEQVRLGVKEDGAAHLVLPVIIVGKAA